MPTDLAPYNQARRSRATFYGLCAACGDIATAGKTKCAFCADQDRQRAATTRETRKSLGLCQNCGMNPTDRTECTRCRGKRNARYARA